MSDIDTVVERLRGTMAEEARQRKAEGRLDGIRWAKQYATVSELKTMAGTDAFNTRWDEDSTLATFISEKEGQTYRTVVDVNDDVPYWDGFAEGGEEIWNAVADKL